MSILQKTAIGFWLLSVCVVSANALGDDAIGDDAQAPSKKPLSEREASKQGIAFFEKQIRPLLVKRCYSCHSSQAKKREGGLALDGRDGWVVGGDSGPAIIPGDTDASLVLQAVRYSDDLQMPPDARLTEAEVSQLERWVRLGAPDPRVKGQNGKPNFDNPSEPETGRTHWAFGPLSKPLPSMVGRNSAIGGFVLAKLKEAKLEPADRADRVTLIRRVYLQLIGLPPTSKQVDLFVDDKRPDAYERLVDRLLASPQFGQRWGRHWLDLARYADSNGLDENFLFREAWRYRNWVIDAINADTTYDRFLLEQLAGDLLPHDSIEQRDRQRIAAGFLVIGPKVLLGNNPQERRMDVADEQLDTIGRAILGQTLGCARCHDHKFDPIPTADYYALAGIFTSTQVMEQRYMLGQQRLMEQLVGLGPDGDDTDGKYEKFWRERPKIQKRIEKAKAALDLLNKGDAKSADEIRKQHADAVAKDAADETRPVEERSKAQKKFLAELVKAAEPPSIPPRAMIPADVKTPADESIRLAGQFDRLGEKVPRGFLRVLSGSPASIPAGDSGRLEFAQWLTAADGAGRTAARVLANRIWRHLLGRGIVKTVDNFGRTGESPSHPQLLDYLANELIESGWSVKHLVRKIVMSEAFRRSSQASSKSLSIDPENRLLWRANRRRLDPEVFRDSMLMIAGSLDLASMDSTVWYLGDQATAVGANKNRRRTDFACRSVYFPVIRNDLPELFDAFDFADPHATTGMRPETMVATQSLFVLNDESVMTAAETLARRLLNERIEGRENALVSEMFTRIIGAKPGETERDELHGFIEEVTGDLSKKGVKDAELQAWTLACHALFASSRFQFVE